MLKFFSCPAKYNDIPFIFTIVVVLCCFMTTEVSAVNFGNISGELFFHGESIDPDFEEKESFLTSHLGIKYESPEFFRLSMAAELRNGTRIWERNKDNADIATGTLLSEAYVQYAGENLILRIGRQKIEQEWIEDYHEASTISFSYNDIFEIYSGYTRRIAIADEEEISTKFEDIGQHGTAFLYTSVKDGSEYWSVHPYVLHTADLFTGYGVKVTSNFMDILGLNLHYAGSDVKDSSDEQTSIFHGFATAQFSNVEIEAGYIKTGRDGVGFLDLLGEHVSPFEEGNLVFETDATTYYTLITYTYNNIELQLIFGKSSAEDAEENEIGVVVAYDFTESVEGLSFEAIYSKVNSENDPEDFSRFLLNLKYEFDFNLEES